MSKIFTMTKTVCAATAASALLCAGGAAFAATDGTLGATSSGSFVNTFGTLARQVRVLGLSDAAMTPSSGPVTHVGGLSQPGVQDSFCVVDTSGGAVNLTFSSGSGMKTSAGAHVREARDAANATMSSGYVLAVGVGVGVSAFTALETTGFTVPAASVVNSDTLCAGGNVNKQIVLPGGGALPSGGAIYTDTVTVLATPV